VGNRAAAILPTRLRMSMLGCPPYKSEGSSMHTIDSGVPTMSEDVGLRAGHAVAVGAADWLSLAAAPTFAIMALLTGVLGGKPDLLCAAMQGTSPLNGMVPMYLLMSAFHLGTWLKLIFGRRGA
jgi:hypothetical protein